VGRYGTLVTTPYGGLLEFAEKGPGAGLVNAGVYLFRRGALEAWAANQPLSMEHDVMPGLLRSGARVGAASLGNCSFLDIGTPESVVQASGFIEANLGWFAG
jgi:NDP-sugar pyrophosphorylase family protein